MHPILFEIFGFKLPAYGVLLVATFLASTYFMNREAARMGLDPRKTWDAAITGLLFGLLGSKLLLILIDLPYYWSNPRELLGTIRSAGVIYGGILGGAIGVIWYIRRHKLPPWATFDVMVPFLALGMGLGRVSCIMAGCCYGVPHEGFLALHFPDHPMCEAPAAVGLFPVQLLDLVNGVLLCLLLVALLRRRKFDGQTTLAFFFIYGWIRGIIEFWRGDTVRGLWFGGHASTSQVIAAAAIVISAVWYWKRRKEAKK